MTEPLRFSTLRWMSRSPAHAKFFMDHPTKDTPSMRLGRLAHAIFLGKNVPTVFEGERRGNAWKSFKEGHDGEDIVTSNEFEQMSCIASALHAHKEARLLLMGIREQTVSFDFAGRMCRTTPDVFTMGQTPDRDTELKLTADASPTRFPYHAIKMAYHAQMAWQKDGLKAAGVADPEILSIVAAEFKPPYAVCVFRLTERAIDFGRRLYRTWIEQFLLCEQSNAWPGYVEGILDAPEEALELVGPDGETFEVTD